MKLIFVKDYDTLFLLTGVFTNKAAYLTFRQQVLITN